MDESIIVHEGGREARGQILRSFFGKTGISLFLYKVSQLFSSYELDTFKGYYQYFLPLHLNYRKGFFPDRICMGGFSPAVSHLRNFDSIWQMWHFCDFAFFSLADFKMKVRFIFVVNAHTQMINLGIIPVVSLQ